VSSPSPILLEVFSESLSKMLENCHTLPIDLKILQSIIKQKGSLNSSKDEILALFGDQKKKRRYSMYNIEISKLN